MGRAFECKWTGAVRGKLQERLAGGGDETTTRQDPSTVYCQGRENKAVCTVPRQSGTVSLQKRKKTTLHGLYPFPASQATAPGRDPVMIDGAHSGAADFKQPAGLGLSREGRTRGRKRWDDTLLAGIAL